MVDEFGVEEDRRLVGMAAETFGEGVDFPPHFRRPLVRSPLVRIFAASGGQPRLQAYQRRIGRRAA